MPGAGDEEILYGATLARGYKPPMRPVIWGLFQNNRSVDPQAPACGRCGYCVQGTPGMICPECGIDLRKSGVIPAAHQLSSGDKIALVGFLLTLVLGAIWLSKLMLETVIPFTESQEISRNIVCSAPLNETIQVISGHRFWQPPIMNHPAMMPEKFILLAPQHEFMEVNLKTGAYRYLTNKTPAPQWKTGTGFTAALLAEWLGERRNNSMDSRVRDFADAVHSAVTEIAKGNIAAKITPLVDRNGIQIGTLDATAVWFGHNDPNSAAIVILALPWILIGIYGFLKMSRV